MKIPRLAAFIFTGVIAFVTATLLACLLYIQINRDEFIQYFLDNVNERLTTPVKVGKIDISYLESFPDISIVLENVQAGISPQPLMTIGRLSFSFHLWNFLDKNYQIRQLVLENADINLLIDEYGKRNFDVFKKKVDSESPSQLSIGTLKLITSRLLYNDEPNDLVSSWEFSTAHIDFESLNDPQLFSVHWTGTNLETHFQGFSYLEGRRMEIEMEGVRMSEGHLQNIKAWEIKEANHQLKGSLMSPDSNELLIDWRGETKSLADLLGNVPVEWPSNWESYALEGEAAFTGKYARKNSVPSLVTDFQGKNVHFRYPGRKLLFTSFETEGRLISSLKADGTSLHLEQLSGTMNDFPIKGKATITNMATMHTTAEAEGSMTLALFETIVPDWGIKSNSGSFTYLLGFEGKLDESKSAEWLIDGETTIENATFAWQDYPLLFRDWSGILLFNDRDVAFTETSGKLGNSDMKVDGLLRNFHFFYSPKNNLLLVEGKISANYLDLNELLSNKKSVPGSKGDAYSLTVSPRLRLKLNAEANTVVFDRFTGTNVSSEVQIQNRQVYVKQLDLSTMGGSIELTGNLSDQSGDTLLTYFSGEVKNLHIDSVFYVFHDFNQTWIQSKHIKGQLFADFDVDMGVRNNLSFLPDLFKARIDVRGLNGELNNFAPMQELSRLVKEDKLDHLVFGELTNQFLIENRKILIPSMEIRSNVSNITLSGTHTFDQEIDYRLKVPLFNRKRNDRDASFGAIEEDERGNLYAHVKIAGTTDDYKVSYDARTAAKSLIENIKEEGKVFLQQIKQEEPEKKAKSLQLKDDDFFEFESDTTKKVGGIKN